ncbi:MAG: hypothetical protein A4E30_00603 [Methanomassiliicoccales archaeon PtaB.Bin215]|nr:MAG: hypothetical protein A4E30_00603 [Methanomassiliicoccales archaeon PtaB.Bin215]
MIHVERDDGDLLCEIIIGQGQHNIAIQIFLVIVSQHMRQGGVEQVAIEYLRQDLHAVDVARTGTAEDVISLSGHDVDPLVLHGGQLGPDGVVLQVGDDLLAGRLQVHHREQQIIGVLIQQGFNGYFRPSGQTRISVRSQGMGYHLIGKSSVPPDVDRVEPHREGGARPIGCGQGDRTDEVGRVHLAGHCPRSVPNIRAIGGPGLVQLEDGDVRIADQGREFLGGARVVPVQQDQFGLKRRDGGKVGRISHLGLVNVHTDVGPSSEHDHISGQGAVVADVQYIATIADVHRPNPLRGGVYA